MLISFFEEFPSTSNLKKLDLIKFPTKLYLADYSIEGYKQYKKELKYNNLKEIIWWPVLNRHEGYWLSPFSKRKALLRTFHHLLNEKIPILWDAELPKNRILLFTQILKFSKNKKLIRNFFKKYKGEIYTAEYAYSNSLTNKLFDYIALFFNPNKYNNKIIKMFYTSMNPLEEIFIKSELEKGVKKYNSKFLVGLGVIATGIRGDEPLISPEQLERDLKICKDSGIKEVIIFRLAGLNEKYLKVINKFS